MEVVKRDEIDYRVIELMIDDKVIGKIVYKLKLNTAWLNLIFVDKEYRNKGIGTKLLMLFENDCIDNRIYKVEGKYYPYDTEGNVVEKFYENNNYCIFKDGYNMGICKYDLKKNIEGLKIKK